MRRFVYCRRLTQHLIEIRCCQAIQSVRANFFQRNLAFDHGFHISAFQADENGYRVYPAESRIVATACGQRHRVKIENKDGSL